MTEHTIKSKNNITESKNDKTTSRSVFSRIGSWFKPGKQVAPEKPREAAEERSRTKYKYSTDKKITRPGHYRRKPSDNAGKSLDKRNPNDSKSHKKYSPPSPQRDHKKPFTESRKEEQEGKERPKNYKGRKPVSREKTSRPSTQILTKPTPGTSKKLLINRDEPEECRIALLEDGRVESFYVETVVHAQTKGNIYKGKITAVEPNLQAAFVDIGTEKNAFLPFSDVHPEYYCKEVNDTHWKNLDIQKVLQKGQEVLVEVVKEAAGTKGANVTTYLSLPGRYMVLMPGSDSAGISRKIEKESQRTRLRKLIETLDLPEGIGYIIRTASEGITKKSIDQDFHYLLNLWKEIKRRGQKMPSPSLVYEERDIFSRFLRDHFTPDIQEILVDNEEAYEQVVNFLSLLPSEQQKTKVKLHQGSRPIFNQYQVEKQIEQIYQPKVTLPSGGSIVISPTEALVAIDVNSGRTSKDSNFEETIFLANMEAAEELARQLRLRDLGGLIVVDFIDMRDTPHIRAVERKVKESMKRDKAKADISRISKFGLMQISRQKIASPVQMGIYKVCEHCQGRGLVQSVETLALVYLRRINTGVINRNVVRAECHLPLDVAEYLLNKKKDDLLDLEKRCNVAINILPTPDMGPTEGHIEFIREQPEN